MTRRLLTEFSVHLLPGVRDQGDVSEASVEPGQVGDAELHQLLEVGRSVDVHQDLRRRIKCIYKSQYTQPNLVGTVYSQVLGEGEGVVSGWSLHRVSFHLSTRYFLSPKRFTISVTSC